MTITQSFAKFAVNLKYEDIPEKVTEKMKAILLHAIGIGLSGYKLQNSLIAKKAIHTLADTLNPEATMMGDGYKASVSDIAFATSVMFHSRIQEDSHGTTHIGTVCNPLGIALAENLHKSGKELITALVAAYEVTCCLCKNYTAESTSHGFRPTPMYGIIGATTVSGLMLGLNEEELVNAYGFAHAATSGPLCPLSGLEGRMEPGIAARNGLLAAQLAKTGAVGNPEAMEYPRGYFKLFCGCEPDADKILKNLGKVWETMNCTVKTYPACQLNQTHIINTLALISEYGPIDVSKINSVLVEGNDYDVSYPGGKFWGPYVNMAQCYNSTPFCVSVCLNYNRCTFGDMTNLEDPATLELLKKVKVEANPDLGSLCSVVTVTMNDGTVYRRPMIITPDYYSYSYDEEVEHILAMKDEIPLSDKKLNRVIDFLRNLEKQDSVDELLSATVVD